MLGDVTDGVKDVLPNALIEQCRGEVCGDSITAAEWEIRYDLSNDLFPLSSASPVLASCWKRREWPQAGL